MDGNTHLAGGLLSFAILSTFFPIDIIFVTGSLIGCILPDVDSNKSKFNSMLPMVGKIWHFGNKLVKNTRFHELSKHRGALGHSWITFVPSIILLLVTGNQFFICLIIGILSHHLLDLFSPVKLRYFYPLKTKIGFFKFPKVIEKILSVLMMLATIALAIA